MASLAIACAPGLSLSTGEKLPRLLQNRTRTARTAVAEQKKQLASGDRSGVHSAAGLQRRLESRQARASAGWIPPLSMALPLLRLPPLPPITAWWLCPYLVCLVALPLSCLSGLLVGDFAPILVAVSSFWLLSDFCTHTHTHTLLQTLRLGSSRRLKFCRLHRVASD